MLGELLQGGLESRDTIGSHQEMTGGQLTVGNGMERSFERDFAVDGAGGGVAVEASGHKGLSTEDGLKPAEQIGFGFSGEGLEIGIADQECLLNEVGGGNLGIEVGGKLFACCDIEVGPATTRQSVERLSASLPGAGNDGWP